MSTHTFLPLPSFAFILTTADVFLLILFFPSGVRVDRHVLHFRPSGGDVKQSTCGRLDEVPVPRKISSTGPPDDAELSLWERLSGED